MNRRHTQTASERTVQVEKFRKSTKNDKENPQQKRLQNRKQSLKKVKEEAQEHSNKYAS